MLENGIRKRRQADKQADKARIKGLQNVFMNINPLAQDPSTQDADTKWHGITAVFGEALQGAQGRVCLWVKTDNEHKILERMVIKEAHPSKDVWEGEDLWLPNSNRKIPREAGIALLFGDPTNGQLPDILKCLRGIRPVVSHPGTDQSPLQASRTQDESDEEKARRKEEELEARGIAELPYNAEATPSNEIAHDNGIVKLLKYGVQPETLTYRLYMEYLPYLNLDQFIMNYMDDGGRPPEPFLWYLLFRLMLACRQMEDVVQLRGNQTCSVIHQDIKYANVFLGALDTNNNALWPLPKVGVDLPASTFFQLTDLQIGDFGSARITTKIFDGPWDPIETLSDKIQPPEYRDERGLSTAVNVWQSAYIVRGLMQVSFPWFDYEKDNMPDMSDTGMYSTELRQVVRGCLARYPQNRYSPQAVLDYISNNQDRFIRGIVAGSNIPFPAATQRLMIDYGADTYRKGFTARPPRP